jgi:hypothetical protein
VEGKTVILRRKLYFLHMSIEPVMDSLAVQLSTELNWVSGLDVIFGASLSKVF